MPEGSKRNIWLLLLFALFLNSCAAFISTRTFRAQTVKTESNQWRRINKVLVPTPFTILENSLPSNRDVSIYCAFRSFGGALTRNLLLLGERITVLHFVPIAVNTVHDLQDTHSNNNNNNNNNNIPADRNVVQKEAEKKLKYKYEKKTGFTSSNFPIVI